MLWKTVLQETFVHEQGLQQHHSQPLSASSVALATFLCHHDTIEPPPLICHSDSFLPSISHRLHFYLMKAQSTSQKSLNTGIWCKTKKSLRRTTHCDHHITVISSLFLTSLSLSLDLKTQK